MNWLETPRGLALIPEPLKALAAMVAAAAVFMGGVLAVSNWLHPAAQPSFPPGTVITIPAAPPAPATGKP